MFFKKKIVLQVMKDFMEGRIATEQFWGIYKHSQLMQKILIEDRTRKKWIKYFNSSSNSYNYYRILPNGRNYIFSPENLLKNVDINNLYHRFELYHTVKGYFYRRKSKIKYYNRDCEEYLIITQIVPSWLDIRDVNFLYGIVNSAPKNFSDKEKIEWSKSKIKKMFKCDDKTPEWIQEPEWPIINGIPYHFMLQQKEEGITKYIFYNPNNKIERIIVEQYE